jgi:large subunit ribosomal protein L17
MRHRVKGRKLSRTTPHRKATLRALSSALIKEHRIETTVAKAKELRTFIEPLITTAKVDNTHNRRKAFSYLQDKYAVSELFETIGPAAADRPGGYTRVLKLGFRLGDAAELAVIELVDFNDVPPEKKETRKKRTRRAGKSNKPVPSPDTKETEETTPAEDTKEQSAASEIEGADKSEAEEAKVEAGKEKVEEGPEASTKKTEAEEGEAESEASAKEESSPDSEDEENKDKKES